MTFPKELKRLMDAATKGEWDRHAQLSAYLIKHAPAIAELVEIVELQNRNWHSPAVTEALAKLNANDGGKHE
jgi:hypothetical protein